MRKLKLPGRDQTKPRLTGEDIRLIEEQGVPEIKEQARRIVENKLKEQPENDGQQTPTAGNPVYKAMHACNCSSRKKLSRAHRIPAGKDLTERQIEPVVNLLIRWIVREYNFYREERKQQQKNLGEFSERNKKAEEA